MPVKKLVTVKATQELTVNKLIAYLEKCQNPEAPVMIREVASQFCSHISALSEEIEIKTDQRTIVLIYQD